MSQPPTSRSLRTARGRRRIARRHRRLVIEGLERRELLAVIRGDDPQADLFSGHVGVCNCPICSGQGLAPVVPLVGFATAPGLGSPLTSLPQLRSNPTASAKLFLDFDGHFEAIWGTHSDVATPAFDTDGDPSTYSAGELNAIQEIWERVSEDYAPFNIDVTTIDPGTQANNVAAIIAVGGSSSDWYGSTAGGISFIGGFSGPSSNVGYAFSLTLGGTAKNVAEAAAHEAGHLFGLQHQSRWNGSTLVEQYHSGSGDWAPLMGVSYQPARTTWFNGATPFGPAILQDDLLVLGGASNGFGWRADDFGSTLATASPLPAAGNSVAVSGLIGRNDDQDIWSFNTVGGPLNFQLTGAAHGTNLDAVLELRNAAGQTVALADPSDSFGATLSMALPAGNYYLVARSTGAYGSLGQYSIVGNVVRGAFPEIALWQGGAALTDGQPFDFGATSLGAPLSRTFTVQNDGTGPLTLSQLDPASLPTGFAIETNLGQTTLNPGQTTTFSLRITATSAGAFGGPFRLTNNDADENPFDLQLSATVVVPDIGLKLNGVALTDGQTVDLGSAIQDSPTTHTITVVNEGTGALQLAPLDPAGFPSGFSLVANIGSSALAPGASTTFTIRVDALAAGTSSGPLRLTSNDPDESPFDLTLTATVLAPEIDVQLDGANIQDGQTVDFGLTSQGQPVLKNFIVANSGTATLTLAPLSGVVLPPGFILVNDIGRTTLGPGQSTAFTLQLAAQAGGLLSGTVQLASNDVDESPFDLALTGRVLAPDIAVLVDSVGVPDGGLVDFGTTTLPLPISRTFTVRNDGLATLTLAPLSAASLPAGFTLEANLGLVTLAPAQSTTFAVRLDATAPGAYGGSLQLLSSDADESPFDVSLAGRVAAPEITLRSNGVLAVDGGLVHFGSTWQGQPTDRTFTIQNDGATALTLAPLNPATLPAGFSIVVNLGAHVLAPGQSTSFTLRLVASSAGSYGGTWALANDDPDENPFDLLLAGTVTAPDIAVEVDGVGIADGAAIDFGTTTPGAPVVRHFVIRNDGAAPLTLAPLSPATLPPGFTLVADQALATLAPGQSSTFVVRLDGAALGTFGGVWSLSSNDADESPFELSLAGRVAAPEIEVLLGGQSLADGQAISFGSAVQGQPVLYVFTVVNRGTADLVLGPLASATIPAGFTLASNIAQTSLAPNQATTFTLRLDAAAPGVFGGSLALGNTDPDENPFDITLSGTVAAPEVVAELAGANLNSGQTTDFGDTPRGTPVVRTFTVRNVGSGALNLVPLSAANMPAGFSLASNLTLTTIASGQSASFSLRLTATTAGTFSGVVSLGSNDADENPFQFVLRGRVTAPDITLRVGATNLTDGQTVDFGTTQQGQPVSRTFTVANEGQAVLTLAALNSLGVPAGFSLVSPPGINSLAPGQTTSFTLQFNAAAGGPVAAPFQLFSTDPDESPFDLVLTGNVLAPEISLESGAAEVASGATIDFGGSIPGLATERTLTVRNVGSGVLNLTPLDPATLPAGFFLASNVGVNSLAPGATTSFTLQMRSGSGGNFGGMLLLMNSDADENPFMLTLVGSVAAPQISVTLDGMPLAAGQAVDFGAAAFGEPQLRTFTIRNLGQAPLELAPLSPLDLPAGFSLASYPAQTNLAPGAATTVVVRLDATALGTYGGRLLLASNDPAAGALAFRLSGSVVAPEIVVTAGGAELSSGQMLDFGTAMQGQPIVRTLTIRNAGSAPLTLASLSQGSLPPGFSLVGDFAPSSMPPGQTAQLTIRLDAAVAGAFGGNFALFSNDADESPFAFTLLGSVVAPEISLLVNGTALASGGAVDFGVTPLGGASTRTITIRNDGNAPLQLAPLQAGALPAGFTLVSNLGTTSLAPGEATALTLRLGGALAGAFGGPLEIVSNDADEGRYALQLQGVLAAPEIVVIADGEELTSGQFFDWGDTLRGTAVVKTITISNTGAAPLNLTPLNPASMPTGFMLLSNLGTTTLAPGATTTFSLRLEATAVGAFSGETTISSNDTDENPFHLPIAARVIDPAARNVIIDLPAGGGDYTLENSAGRLRLRQGANTLLARTLETVESLTLQGSAATDTLTVSFAGGVPLPAGGVQFIAGDAPAGDVLIVQGASSQSLDWSAGDLSTSGGTFTTAGRSFTYRGVRSLEFSGLGQARLSLANATNALSIGQGTTAVQGLPALVVQGTSDDQALPAIALRNNNSLVIASAGSASDVVTLNAAVNGHGNQNLSIDTGSDASDWIDVIGAVALTGAVSLSSGRIVFPQPAGRVTAAQVMLSASRDIADASPGIARVVAAELTATAANGIGLATAAPIVHAQVTGPGNLELRAAGDTTLAEARTQGGNILVQADGTIAVGLVDAGAGEPGDVTLNAAGGIHPLGVIAPAIHAASLTLDAGMEIGSGDAPLTVAADSLAATAAAGDLFVSALGDLSASGASQGDLSIRAAGSLLIGGATASASSSHVTLEAGQNLTVAAGAVVGAANDVRLAFGQDNVSAAAAALAGQIVSLAGVEVRGGLGADSFLVPSPQVFVAPRAMLLGQAGSDTFVAQPQAQAALIVWGGDSAGAPGDVLDLDLSPTAVDPAATAIVNAALAGKAGSGAGLAITTGYGDVEFSQLDQLLLRDQGALIGVALGGMYIRGSQAADIIDISPGASPTQVQLRLNDQLLALARPTHTLVIGRDGNDFVQQAGLGSPVEMRGNAGDDVLNGDSAADVLSGGDGRDTLSGLSGDDYLTGEGGDDTLYGGDGNDRLYGGAGRDVLFGDDGHDALAAGDGRDQLHGGRGRDIVIGGFGPDQVGGDADDDLLVSGRVAASGGSTASAAPGDVYDVALTGLLADWSADGRLDSLLETLSDYSIDVILGGDGTDLAAVGAGDTGDWDQLLP